MARSEAEVTPALALRVHSQPAAPLGTTPQEQQTQVGRGLPSEARLLQP